MKRGCSTCSANLGGVRSRKAILACFSPILDPSLPQPLDRSNLTPRSEDVNLTGKSLYEAFEKIALIFRMGNDRVEKLRRTDAS